MALCLTSRRNSDGSIARSAQASIPVFPPIAAQPELSGPSLRGQSRDVPGSEHAICNLQSNVTLNGPRTRMRTEIVGRHGPSSRLQKTVDDLPRSVRAKSSDDLGRDANICSDDVGCQ